MRVALVHDYLNQYGGAERVLEAFCEIFPEAPIYTLFYDKEKTFGKFEEKKIITSFLNNKLVNNKHRLFIPLMPLAASLMKISNNYDLVLSSSAGYAKGIPCGKDAMHISYCHTPLRYAWEYKKYFKWPWILKIVTAPIFLYLKKWDKYAGQKPQTLIANSKYIAGKIENYYERKSEIIYPPVDTQKFFINSAVLKNDYFLAVGRMMSYKKFDLIIKAFNKLNLPLLIVGGGPELNKLKKLAKSPKIKFLENIKDKELNNLYNSAQALIFPQVEDFGLVAAEAQACGLPVIALNEGGAKEIISDGKTGILFARQTVDDLISAVEKFKTKEFNKEEIGKSALRFSKDNFKQEILKIINLSKSIAK
jgi:glycosyltransferase involved in cell wall biosynthesis